MTAAATYVPALDRVRAAVRALPKNASHDQIGQRANVAPESVGMFLIEMGQRRPGRPRLAPQVAIQEPELQNPNVTVDLASNQMARGPYTIKLTPSEAEIAQALADTAPAVVPRHVLFQALYGSSAVTSAAFHNVTNRIAQVRPKFAQLGCEIRTVHGRGYRLVLAEAKP